MGDVELPGMLHAAFVRSPYANAQIVSIDTAEARDVPGVVDVFIAEDLTAVGQRDTVTGRGKAPFPPLATQTVLFVGDPVALVIAETRAAAEDGAEMVVVDYEPGTPVVTIDDALREGAPVVHPELGSNVHSDMSVGSADTDSVLASAAHVITETVAQQRHLACPMETRGVVASWQSHPARMTIWISSQGAHVARDHFAALLELPSTDVRVIVNDVGGGFGLKISVGREEGAVALAARLVGSPIKWIEDRWENLVSGPHAREERGEVTLGLDDDGHFLAIKADHLENIGAYGMIAASDFSIRLIAGPYRVGHSHGRNRRVRTNTSRRVAYRGPWLFETLGREVMIDIAARRLGIDPLEMRRRNVLQASDLPYQMSGGHTVDRVTPAETLEQVAGMVGYEEFRSEQARQRQAGRYLGIGLSLYVEPSAMGAGIGATEAATIRIDQSGHVQLITGANSQGHSIETTMVQVVADQLGLSMEDVTVVRGDTDAVPVGATTGGSRNAVFGGGAALKAGTEMRDRIVRIAAELPGSGARGSRVVGATRLGARHANPLRRPQGGGRDRVPGTAQTAGWDSPGPRGGGAICHRWGGHVVKCGPRLCVRGRPRNRPGAYLALPRQRRLRNHHQPQGGRGANLRGRGTGHRRCAPRAFRLRP